MDRAALADFLRRHREALRPDDVGLPVGARRRACGLRREEVAALAVMSVDYYTRLEQQRGPQPSEQMLTSLAEALRLTGSERDYLFQTAGHNPPALVTAAAQVAPALLHVLDRLSDTPALILSSLGETLEQNRMAEALFGDRSRCTGLARSEIYRWFTDPAERLYYPEDDRDRQSRAMVAGLRAAYRTMGPNSRAGELVRVLQNASPEFARLWKRHEVTRRFIDHKILIHPKLGTIEVDCQALFHRGPIPGAAGTHCPATHRGLRKAAATRHGIGVLVPAGGVAGAPGLVRPDGRAVARFTAVAALCCCTSRQG